MATDDSTSIDLPHCKTAEIMICGAHDGTRLWLHIDGELRCRVYRIGDLTLEDRRPSQTNALVTAAYHVLQRCNDNGGEIDRELVAEIKAALGEDRQ